MMARRVLIGSALNNASISNRDGRRSKRPQFSLVAIEEMILSGSAVALTTLLATALLTKNAPTDLSVPQARRTAKRSRIFAGLYSAYLTWGIQEESGATTNSQ